MTLLILLSVSTFNDQNSIMRTDNLEPFLRIVSFSHLLKPMLVTASLWLWSKFRNPACAPYYVLTEIVLPEGAFASNYLDKPISCFIAR